MQPAEEELSFVSTSSEFIICEDSEPERLAKVSNQSKPSSSSLAIHNSTELNSNKSSSIIKPNKNELKLASNLTFKAKSPYFQKPIVPNDKIDSSVQKLSTSSTTRIEKSSILSNCPSHLNLDKQSPLENLDTSTNTTLNAIDVNAEKRATNSIHVETDSSIEIGKSSVSRFIDRQSSRGSKSPSISPKTRIRAISVKSDSISASSNSSSDGSVDIPYHTLTRLNSCPACSDDWNTYKAPRSKLTHIKKCAKTNLIRPKDITTRIQKILNKQITNDTDSSSLLDLHIQSKNVQLNILEQDPQVQKSLKNDLLFKPPKQSRSHQPNPSTSGLTDHTAEKQIIGSSKSSILPGANDALHSGIFQGLKGDTEQVNQVPASPALKPGDDLATPSNPDRIHRSTLLAQARSRSRTRNSLISSNGKTPYTLWDAAGGHDGFDFQRSPRDDNESLNEAVPNINENSSVEATPREPKVQNSNKAAFEHETSDSNLDSNTNRNNDCNIERIPSFEKWTRKEIQNENERLGFEDASDASSSILIQRAKDAWRETALEVLRLQERNDFFSLEDESSFDEGGMCQRVLNEGSDMDQRKVSPYKEASRLAKQELSSSISSQQGTKANCRVTAPTTYIGGTGGGYASDGSQISRPGDDVNVEDNDRVCGGELEWIPSEQVMPDYSSYSKSALEVEYFSLHSQQQDQKQGSEIPSPSPALPKTKSAILARVIKLWETINNQELTGDGLSQVSDLKKQKKIPVPKKKKLSSEEIDQLLTRVCVEDEKFYMEILRYEPFKLSVFENKVADAVRIENAKPISSLILSKWLDWQAISYFTLDPTVSRKRH